MAMTMLKTWEIVGAEVIPTLFQYQNVIKNVKWKLSLSDQESSAGQTVVTMYGLTFVGLPYADSNYQAYENLTEAELLTWVFSKLGSKKTYYERELELHYLNTLHAYNNNIVLSDKQPDFVIHDKNLGGYYEVQNFPLVGNLFIPNTTQVNRFLNE